MSWNAAAWRLFGYNAAEIIGHPITVQIPPKLLAEEDEIIARLKSNRAEKALLLSQEQLRPAADAAH